MLLSACMRRFGEKGLALAQWSFLLDSPQIAHIYGTRGEIDMERVHCPEHLRVTYSDGKQMVRICHAQVSGSARVIGRSRALAISLATRCAGCSRQALERTS